MNDRMPRHHYADYADEGTGCDEVNSEHVPRPAGAGRITLTRPRRATERGKAPTLFIGLVQGEIRGHMPGVFVCSSPAVSSLLLLWGRSPQPPHAHAQGQADRLARVVSLLVDELAVLAGVRGARWQ